MQHNRYSIILEYCGGICSRFIHVERSSQTRDVDVELDREREGCRVGSMYRDTRAPVRALVSRSILIFRIFGCAFRAPCVSILTGI